nr:MAG TPA: protein of unknown function (DUF5438) [Bacteriophage sp.]
METLNYSLKSCTLSFRRLASGFNYLCEEC